MAAKTAEREKTKEIATQEKQELTVESTRPGRFFTPAVDIFETDGAITVLADMPGVAVDGLTIDLRENVLTIEGVVEEPANQDERMLIREYETGGFRREFRLASTVDQSKIDAKLRDGVLRLTLPKAEAARPRKIRVQAG